jgi:hypothetical protein
MVELPNDDRSNNAGALYLRTLLPLRSFLALCGSSLIDRATQCFELAKSIRNRALARTPAERAAVLKRFFISTEPAIGKALRRSIVFSKAKRLGTLRCELNDLSAGISLGLEVQQFTILLSSRDAWHDSRRLAEEFGCNAEFRPDGYIWFVKRD